MVARFFFVFVKTTVTKVLSLFFYSFCSYSIVTFSLSPSIFNRLNTLFSFLVHFVLLS